MYSHTGYTLKSALGPHFFSETRTCGRRLIQCMKSYSYRGSKHCHCLFPNNGSYHNSYIVLYIPGLPVIFIVLLIFSSKAPKSIKCRTSKCSAY